MSSVPREASTSDKCAIGILLVHGIGLQKKGATRQYFGRPLRHWLRRWLAGAERAWRRDGRLTGKAIDDWLALRNLDADSKAHSILAPLRRTAPSGAVAGAAPAAISLETIAHDTGFDDIASVRLGEASGIDGVDRAWTTLEMRVLRAC